MTRSGNHVSGQAHHGATQDHDERGRFKSPVVKSSTHKASDCGKVLGDAERAPWLAVLHGLTVIVVGLRKHLKIERCEHCGR